MRSLRFFKFGPPAEVLALSERPVPVPAPGEIRIRMKMSPIHNHDMAIISGSYGYKPTLPAIPGTEAVGVVDALGAGVEHPAVGQRVAVAGASATWAEYFVAAASSAVPLPSVVPDETACQLLAMPLSASMLLEDLQIKKGDWIIQNAANGVVGKTLASLAKARGINVVNLVRRDTGVRELEALGIDNAVATDHPGWETHVTEVTCGAPIVRAVDSIGGEATDKLMGFLAEGGMLMSFGSMSGQPMQISTQNLLFKQATVKGFWGSKRSESTTVEDFSRMIGDLVRMAVTGELRLAVESSFDLSHAAEAFSAHLRPGRVGKVTLTA